VWGNDQVQEHRMVSPCDSKLAESVVLGQGAFQYRVERNWAKLPDGWTFHEVAAVAVDHKDQVYVFNRGQHPMMVFDRDGNFLRSWGKGLFQHAHGIDIASDGAIYCTDDGDHTVRKMSPDGRVLMQIGVPGAPAPFMSGTPFHRCTHTALSPEGHIYVSDGYGNACIHQYDPNGRLIRSWGGPGSGPGEFNLPHNLACDNDGWIYVADRENHRIQVFDRQGRYETQWNNLHRPSGFYMTRGCCPLCYVGEIGPYLPVNRHYPNLGPRISILDKHGTVLARLGREQDAAGQKPGQFMSPHGIAVDTRGDVYIGEVAVSAWPSLFPDKPRPPQLNTLQKLIKLEDRSGTVRSSDRS
jgi:DNA-binding beta-propeller fold protein YncE